MSDRRKIDRRPRGPGRIAGPSEIARTAGEALGVEAGRAAAAADRRS